MMTSLLSIALGGALGASARYLTGLAALRLFGAGFPWGTLTVNVLGSFLMGLLFVLLGQGGRFSPLLMTGLLGGFTTFSAFSLDAVALYDKGAVGLAGIYVLASVILSITALIAGIALARSFAA
ncbi:MAG: fluoride efflux transporter CrcB [Paracoccaceae bacterium]|jgi:CrcB protein|nr:fluoride efflux transporter CrcB [Paracoccaceae bacterium]MDP7185017.1 fluoride efflux transporter CrcB [Paracoccaceae bacterium]